MKKFLRLALIGFIIGIILVTQIPITVLGANVISALQEAKSKAKETTEKKDAEVIIMYKQDTTENNTNKRKFLVVLL